MKKIKFSILLLCTTFSITSCNHFPTDDEDVTIKGTVETSGTIKVNDTVMVNTETTSYLYKATGSFTETVYDGDKSYYSTDENYTEGYTDAINDNSVSSGYYPYSFYKKYYSTYKQTKYNVTSALIRKTKDTNTNYEKFIITIYGYKNSIDAMSTNGKMRINYYIDPKDRDYKPLLTYTIYKVYSWSYYEGSLEEAPNPTSYNISINKIPENSISTITRIQDTGIAATKKSYNNFNYYKTTTGTCYSDVSINLTRM